MIPEGHNTVAQACYPLLKAARPSDDYAYFYLGNWFTDVSQAIAPVDYAAAMSGALRRARRSTIWPNSFADPSIDRFIKQLLGDPPSTGSKLASYFRDVVYVVGWSKFCRDFRRVFAEGLLDFKEYDRIFNARFTQYFPHEHLDRWPMDRGGRSKRGRRVYEYLERDLIYVSELLTLVERDWAKSSDAGVKNDPKRHDLLVEFGHAMHAVEDFFAHSNYVEFAIRHHDPDRFRGKPDLQRKFERRLMRERVPRVETFSAEDKPIPPSEAVAEEDVVTGYFDSIDTNFSLDGVYRHLLDKLEKFPTSEEGKFIDLLDYRKHAGVGLPEAERSRGRKEYKDSCTHYHDRVLMPQEVRNAHFRFVELDWSMMDKEGERAGRSISTIIREMIKEGEKYRTESFRLPDGSTFPYAERYGSHSLLAKDDPEKEPGYKETMRLATRVGTYIAGVMVRKRASVVRVTPHPADQTVVVDNGEEWVDWFDLLSYFCGHPEEAQVLGQHEGRPFYWWIASLNGRDEPTGHVPKFINKKTADQRCRLETRKLLEEEHNGMIPFELHKYEQVLKSDVKHWTKKLGVSIRRGERHRYFHDSVVQGIAWVLCEKGQVRVDPSIIDMGSANDDRRVGTSLGVVTVSTYGVWSGEFPHLEMGGQDSRYYQSNVLVIIGVDDDSIYQLSMSSW